MDFEDTPLDLQSRGHIDFIVISVALAATARSVTFMKL